MTRLIVGPEQDQRQRVQAGEARFILRRDFGRVQDQQLDLVGPRPSEHYGSRRGAAARPHGELIETQGFDRCLVIWHRPGEDEHPAMMAQQLVSGRDLWVAWL